MPYATMNRDLDGGDVLTLPRTPSPPRSRSKLLPRPCLRMPIRVEPKDYDELDSACTASTNSAWSRAPTVHSQSTPPASRPQSRASDDRTSLHVDEPATASTITSTTSTRTAHADNLGPSLPGVTYPGSEELAQDPDFALEMQAAYLLGPDHLRRILKQDDLLFNFNSFLLSYRPADVAVLQYYLSALRALDLISAANSLITTLPSSYDYGFDPSYVPVVTNPILERKVEQAFAVLQYESLPAYVAYGFHMTNAALHRKVTRALGEGSSVQSDSLAQMFCVTDPEQIDNPIIFASKEFSRSTNYPMRSILNRNPSFLHGPMTDLGASDRIASAIAAQRSHSEVMVSYRSDGSPFLSLQTVTPLRDTRGRLRYWLRGFVDCSDLLGQGASSWSFPRNAIPPIASSGLGGPKKPESKLRKAKSFYSVYTEQSVSLENYPIKLDEQTLAHTSPTSSTTAVELPATPVAAGFAAVGFEDAPGASQAGYPMGLDMRSPGIYHRYLLVRPTQPFRILFVSPALAQSAPRIAQSPFMSHIGGDQRVRAHLENALVSSRKVTAKISWVATGDGSDPNAVGRMCWAHCTPLFGEADGVTSVGVWMILLLDEEPAPAAF